MAKGNHITQESYIRKITENKGFNIFYKERGQYKWKFSIDYTNKLFIYRRSIAQFDPEKNGKNKILQNLESNINILFKGPQTITTLEDYNYTLDYGLSIKARYEAAKILEKYDIHDQKYEDILQLLKSSCILYIPQESINAINNHIKQTGQGFDEVHFLENINARIVYPKNYLLLSENSCYYKSDIMIYPINSNELFFAYKESNMANIEMKKELIKSQIKWFDIILSQSDLYLIAHKDCPTETMNYIQELYNNGTYKLEEV